MEVEKKSFEKYYKVQAKSVKEGHLSKTTYPSKEVTKKFVNTCTKTTKAQSDPKTQQKKTFAHWLFSIRWQGHQKTLS